MENGTTLATARLRVRIPAQLVDGAGKERDSDQVEPLNFETLTLSLKRRTRSFSCVNLTRDYARFILRAPSRPARTLPTMTTVPGSGTGMSTFTRARSLPQSCVQ